MRKSTPSQKEFFDGKHRAEHWYRDNSVYFITARVSGRRKAFASETAKAIFWAKLEQYAKEFGFVLIVVTLMDNHYHLLGYLPEGKNLGPMMQRFHGAVAKLVNDTLKEKVKPFWRDGKRQSYFDGCIRDDKQFTRSYRYVRIQSVRHGTTKDYRTYPHTRELISLERALKRALEKKAFLPHVPYARYQA